MEYVNLGQSGMRVSRVCFGCAAIGGYDYGAVDDEISIRAVRRAIDLGVNFFDVADVYGFGRAETIVGRAIKGRRNDVVIATKFGVGWDALRQTKHDLSPDQIEVKLDASLTRLGVDYVDLYQIHWPDHKTPLVAVIQELTRLQQKGKLRTFGCCNFTQDMVCEVESVCAPVSMQMPFSLAERQYEPILRYSESEGIATLSYSTLGQGLFTGKYDSKSVFVGTDLRRRSALFNDRNLARNLRLVNRVKDVAGRLGRTAAQVAIRWVLQTPCMTCAIVGAKTDKQVAENVGAIGWELPEAEYELLSAASREK